MKLSILKGFAMTMLLGALSPKLMAQHYTLDALKVTPRAEDPLPMQGTFGDKSLAVNSNFFLRNGKVWYPLMGEMHYNRVLPQDWESEILKMKSAGLNIIATYVFWNEHEIKKGIWDWIANRDLRRFLEICKKQGMYVWLRIGPWSHGEQRWGGFPDWIQEMRGKRTNDPAYLAEAKKIYQQIAQQTQGLYFKDGGPIIGTQLENEYASGQKDHIRKLKEMAQAAGIAPVYWTVTANSVFDDKEKYVIPLQGAYAYRGWEFAGGKATNDFLYGNDQWIMTDALGGIYYDTNLFPRGMCEQGAGSQMTYQNRFIADPVVIQAHAQNQVGRGMNMMGYYMFHGGTQTNGLEEHGLPMSYDFQAPVGEFGLVKDSYRELKSLHNFLNDFGAELAPMTVVESPKPVTDPANTTDLRYVGRVKENSAFLFFCNTQSRMSMPDKEVSMNVKLPSGEIQLPRFVLKGNTTAILPVNLKVGEVNIKYALAQPFAKLINGSVTTLFFKKLKDVRPQLELEGSAKPQAAGWTIKPGKNSLLFAAGKADQFSVKDAGGNEIRFVFLNADQAGHALRFEHNGVQGLAISNADVFLAPNGLELNQLDKTNFSLKIYPRSILNNKQAIRGNRDPWADSFAITVPSYSSSIDVKYNGKADVDFRLPANTLPESVKEIFVDINYIGSKCDVSQNNKIVTDNIFNGTPWLLGLDRFKSNEYIHLKLKPWTKDISGLDEKSIADMKTNGPAFRSIKSVPSYSVFFGYNK